MNKFTLSKYILVILISIIFYSCGGGFFDDANNNSNNLHTDINKSIFRGIRSYSAFSTNLVKDNLTGLIWQKQDDGNERTWQQAKIYCSNLSLDGSNDFRLPNFKELYYLADRKKYNPAINTNYFNVKSSYYWTNSFGASDPQNAWSVHFKYGDDNWDGKSDKGYVLCVRGQ